MIAKLKNVKPNNDDTITLYLDKGTDLMYLMGLRGKEIEISKADEITTLNESIFTPLFERSGSIIREAYELGKQEEQARHDMPAPEGEE